MAEDRKATILALLVSINKTITIGSEYMPSCNRRTFGIQSTREDRFEMWPRRIHDIVVFLARVESIWQDCLEAPVGLEARLVASSAKQVSNCS